MPFKWLFPHPPVCVLCTRPVAQSTSGAGSHAARICRACDAELGWIREPWCAQCGRPLGADSERHPREDTLCVDCERFGAIMPMRNRAVTRYTPLAREVIATFKYRGRQSLAEPFGQWMADVVHREYRRVPIDAVTYVPLHPRRLAERGFNQAALLADVIGRELRLPVETWLVREQDTSPQSKKTRRARLAHLHGVFNLHFPEGRNFPHRPTLLLVDDVYTTGSTLRACTRVLLAAGVHQIVTVTFAR